MYYVAEEVRFELTRPLRAYGFSRAALSTAQPLLLNIVDLPGIEPGPPPCHGGVMPIYYRPIHYVPPRGIEPLSAR